MKQESVSVVDSVLNGITDDMIRGRLNPGEKLPTEPELCLRYHAGRNSVREAIKKLEANGVVYIKRADGTYISDTYHQEFLDPMLYSIILQKNSWQDFVELRSAIEIGTLQVIIHDSRTGKASEKKDSYDTMEKILSGMEKELYRSRPSIEKIMEWDTAFHEALVERTGNPQLMTITRYITRLTIPSRRETVSKVLHSGETDNFLKLHRKMLDVVREGLSSQVVETVLEHYIYWKEEKE